MALTPDQVPADPNDADERFRRQQERDQQEQADPRNHQPDPKIQKDLPKDLPKK